MKKLSVLMLFVGVAAFSFGQKIVNTSGDAKVAFLKVKKPSILSMITQKWGLGNTKLKKLT